MPAAGWARRAQALILVLVGARLVLVALRIADGSAGGLASPWAPLVLVYQDLWFVAGWALLDWSLWRALRRRPRGIRWAERVGWSLFAALAIYAAINVPIARVFSTPLTWPLLRAAGGPLEDSIMAYATASNLIAGAAVLALAVVAWRTRRVLAGRGRAIALSIAGVAMVSGPLLRSEVRVHGLHRNVVVALVGSTADHLGWFSGAAAEPEATALPPEGAALDLSHFAGAARDFNVVVVVLESTGARYLKLWGGDEVEGVDPTPRLTQLLSGSSVLFDKAYAVHPESIKGLFSTICSIFPAAQTRTREHVEAKVPCESLAYTLGRAGYRTALFHSGRFVYLGMAGIIAERGFEHLADASDIGGRFVSSFGTDDASTADALLAWVDGLGGDERFFAMYMPIAGHHPYHSPGDAPRPFPEASERDAYINDLHVGDHALGRLIDGIRARGLMDRTLWVVFGDHGQAFYQHEGNFAHSLYVYEENLHVPLAFVLPGALSEPVVAPQVAELIDVAPTIAELVGVAPPDVWQGRSLLAAEPQTALFFADHTQLLAGVRHGDWKYIHNFDAGKGELFHLPTDPLEQRDIADEQAARVDRYRAHVKAWIAAQRARIRGR